jgi:hypothetical protein
MQHTRTLERLREPPDVVDDLVSDHRRVVVEVLLQQGDAIEHGRSGWAGGRNLGQSIE